MAFKIEMMVWIITLFVIVPSILELDSIIGKVYNNITPSIPKYKSEILSSLDRITTCPKSEKNNILSLLSKEIPVDKVPLLKSIKIENNELYVILYNDIPCRFGEIKDIGEKFELALKILESAKEKKVKIREIDVRSLKFPVIKEVDAEK